MTFDHRARPRRSLGYHSTCHYHKFRLFSFRFNWRGKHNPQKVVIYSLLQELARRDGLNIALSGRNEDELYPILLFTRFSFLEPKYSSFMLDVFNMIIGKNGFLKSCWTMTTLPPSCRYIWRDIAQIKARCPACASDEDKNGERVGISET